MAGKAGILEEAEMNRAQRKALYGNQEPKHVFKIRYTPCYLFAGIGRYRVCYQGKKAEELKAYLNRRVS